jgi:signal transduction histidine kinase
VRADEDEATLEVEDGGIGIAPEDFGRIFDRFERASGDHRRESLGLGLYIARAFVEAHGGTISVESDPGRGSKFTLRLPRKRLPERGPWPVSGPTPAVASENTSGETR